MSNMSMNGLFRNGIKIKVGNGEMTQLWEDVWASELP